MKKITFILFALIAGTSFGQNSADATATTFAEIVEPLKITKDRDLNFGRIIGGSSGGGVVTLAAEEAPTRDIPVDLDAPLGTVTTAQFTITSSQYNYSITTAPTVLVAKGEGDNLGADMELTTTSSLGDASTGNQTLYVGGSLTVGAEQLAGIYEGEVKVTVSYE